MQWLEEGQMMPCEVEVYVQTLVPIGGIPGLNDGYMVVQWFGYDA